MAELPHERCYALRGGDLAYCLPTDDNDPAYGLTSCSLITNQLLANPSQTCATAGFNNGRCMMVQQATGTYTNGTLIGVCADAAATNVDVWGLCQPAPSTNVCAPGTACVEQDVFAANPSGPTRCVPLFATVIPKGNRRLAASPAKTPNRCQRHSRGLLIRSSKHKDERELGASWTAYAVSWTWPHVSHAAHPP